MWRFIRTWVTHNHKLYYTYILACACGVNKPRLCLRSLQHLVESSYRILQRKKQPQIS